MNTPNITFRFLADPGHGWLEVPEAISRSIGIRPENYSPYSYVKRNNPADNILYLEEDLDAGFFAVTWKKKFGEAIDTEYVYEEKSTVRGLPRLSGENYSCDAMLKSIRNMEG